MIRSVTRLIKNCLKNYFKIFLVEIDGFSLWPELKPGEIYLGSNKVNKLKIGDYIIFSQDQDIFIKKLVYIGDNFLILQSLFDKKIYLVNKNQVLGKIIKNFKIN